MLVRLKGRRGEMDGSRGAAGVFGELLLMSRMSPMVLPLVVVTSPQYAPPQFRSSRCGVT